MRFRGKSIRRKIVALLLVPLVSLTVLWVFATVITGMEADRLLSAAEVTRGIGHPTEAVVDALQKERRQALVVLAGPRSRSAGAARARTAALTELRARQRATDRAAAALRSGASGDVREDMSPTAADWFRTMERRLAGLGALRARVAGDTVTRDAAFLAYNEVIDPHLDFLSLLGSVQDAGLEQQRRALVGLTYARESLSREDALLAAALTARTISARELRLLADRMAERRILYATNLPVLPARDQKTYDDYWRGTSPRTLKGTEEAVVSAGPAKALRALDTKRWQATAGTVLDDLARLGHDAQERHEDRLEPVATWVLTKAAVAGVLGLAALVCSVVVSWRVGRGLVRDLRQLRREAHEVSGVRLPAVLRRLAAGEQVDVETEAPRLEYPPDELGQVGRALNSLQRAAVEAAVKQAEMRRGVSDVFVNIARRSQVLLHRQLALLDTMERRTEDADELADLFRLDHLTTRMRRHAEGLVILSGATPSRQWRKPVQLMDVVRAAVSEVEAYERIELRRLPPLAVQGPAVADLTHLLAELLENATVFSPPHTAVQVVGERVPNGFTLEIHDRGLGMSPDALLEANLGLAEAPEFDLSDTDRLGLFVVSRLARRQGVRVSLQPSPYGGTTAVVLIPAALFDEAPPKDAAPGARARKAARKDGPVELEPPLSPLEKLDVRDAVPVDADPLGAGPLGADLLGTDAPLAPRGPRDARRPLDARTPREPWKSRVPLDAPVHDRPADQPPARRPAAPAPAFGSRGPDRRPGSGTHGTPDGRGTAGRETPGGLPRRPRPPVLVSDHGRPVADRTDRAERADATDRRDRADRADPADRADRSDRSDRPGPSGPSGIPDRQDLPDLPDLPNLPDLLDEPTPPTGLPRRVRQAGLAPLVRENLARESRRTAAEPADHETARDPEEVRARMTSLQRGWQRGRADAPHPTEHDSTRTTNERDGR
ncbi:nitrate- and nitrite sensing domain-containing protein [Streptomyces mobaraensis NBRC 13819 = DSM 40847]|uniref:histidine kinase n=1 Tax=Streptomyces mobaraensis (strain ATCC 29032 / DSM 40847 / JCM 4168 / NBRC 13819 / NCIMB 11159 / IPCR 16-22) TaxID=1223523 RepID=M3C0N0_STRM1|nr:sensor-like histidine kinase [Streptomyces mobaraensis NBRC 13819 = DSM 40847]QTT72749.1 nitrate- and nitrite sensing domain-containing protein [Streptomyces mobaraensis NBRC 13819 = DSM 40847]